MSQLQVRASITGTTASALVIIVSAPDIAQSLVFNINIGSGAATGSITLPVGNNRLIVVRAFNAAGVTTHEGSAHVDVLAGSNPAVSITLVPLVADQPIDVRIGTLLVRVTPETGLIAPRQVIALAAVVTDLDGTPVAVNPADIRWATFDTRVATVDVSGRVTGLTVGGVQVVASYAGAAGGALVTVGHGLVTAGDIAECDAGDEATASIVDTLDGVVLPLGDNAYEDGTLAEYLECYHPSWGRHKARSRPVPGNHEYRTPNAAGYFAYWGALAGDPAKGYYSFDVGSWHLIALNSEIDFGASGAQMAWLIADLASTTAKCVLAYWHRPRFSSGDHHGNDARYQPFWQALYDAGADVVLAGHEHLYERFAPQTPTGVADPARGIRQFLVGTGGRGLYAFKAVRVPTSEFGMASHGVLGLALGPDRYSWRFIARGGRLEDSGTASCH